MPLYMFRASVQLREKITKTEQVNKMGAQGKKKHGEGGASPGLTDTLSKEQFKYDMEKLNLKKILQSIQNQIIFPQGQQRIKCRKLELNHTDDASHPPYQL